MITSRNRLAVARDQAAKQAHHGFVTTGFGDVTAECGVCGPLVRFAEPDWPSSFGWAFEVLDVHKAQAAAPGRSAA